MRVRAAVAQGLGLAGVLAAFVFLLAGLRPPAPDAPLPSGAPAPVAAAIVGATVEGCRSPWREPETRRLVPPPAPASSRSVAASAHPPRTLHDVLPHIVLRPESTCAEALLRNATFNPDDMTVDAALLAQVQTLVSGGVAEAADLKRRLASAEVAELTELVAAGGATRIDGLHSGARPLRQLGPDPVLHRLGETTWAAPRERMPDSLALHRRLRTAGVRLCEDLAVTFHAAGCVSAEAAGEIRRRARALAQHH